MRALIVVTLTLLMASLAGAATMIDTFDVTWQLVSIPGTASSSLAATEALGGYRYMEVSRTEGDADVVGEANRSSDGQLHFSVGDTTLGTLLVVWDGYGDMNEDLGDVEGFTLRAWADLATPAVITIVNNGVSYSSGTFNLVGGGVWTNVFIPLFSPVNDVEEITLSLSPTSPATDIAIDFFEASDVDTPEPASLVLVGVGLLGLNLLRRRRQQA